MDGCIYRTKDGECDLYSEGGKFKAFCDPEHCDNIAPTNADRIRAMTDDELASLLMYFADDTDEIDEKDYDAFGNMEWRERVLRWLKQEVKE